MAQVKRPDELDRLTDFFQDSLYMGSHQPMEPGDEMKFNRIREGKPVIDEKEVRVDIRPDDADISFLPLVRLVRGIQKVYPVAPFGKFNRIVMLGHQHPAPALRRNDEDGPPAKRVHAIVGRKIV